MTHSDLVQYRLHHQHLTQSWLTTPGDLVAWFGAVQGQDYAAGKWALGNRLPGSTDAGIEQAIADRTILRTWPMRGTLHFVAAADIHWILDLNQPRLQTLYASHFRRLELSEPVIAKSKAVFTKALSGGHHLTRSELKTALEQAGIPAHENRLSLLLARASYDRLLCHGVRRDKEFTFTLLDDWVPPTKPLLREEALAEWTRRYFTSHGPATLADFSWWSGLTLTDAKIGMDLIKSGFVSEVVAGQTYWMPASLPTLHDHITTAYLLPVYDEYLVAYKDRSGPLGGLDPAQIAKTGNGIFSPVIVIDGRVAGTWKRTLKKDSVWIETSLFTTLTDAQQQALSDAKERYRRFLGTSPVYTAHSLTAERLPVRK
ncbi:winged helix DNA-binding domain-containing protein [Larkinella humicola]|uniref:Winged helix DNA-binding domain-containing protein n=1 Tax=Larkinella humicola TaxID=2607654 RepID=A0A5N1JJH1_9BACT|nr:winged helix DNA-binding domain-containing protein [Larkinella humicola]KAA9355292.1 winged helix DNA-binding domain-containing protein [Larkinella humicola]